MICRTCNQDVAENDFLHSTECYKCVYRRKTLKALPKKKIVIQKESCPICTHCIPKGRNRFCSDECSYVFKLKTQKTYWTKSIQILNSTFNQ